MSYIINTIIPQGNNERVFTNMEEYIKVVTHNKKDEEALRMEIKKHKEVNPYKNFEIHKITD